MPERCRCDFAAQLAGAGGQYASVARRQTSLTHIPGKAFEQTLDRGHFDNVIWHMNAVPSRWTNSKHEKTQTVNDIFPSGENAEKKACSLTTERNKTTHFFDERN
jgi:hypothetical protein